MVFGHADQQLLVARLDNLGKGAGGAASTESQPHARRAESMRAFQSPRRTPPSPARSPEDA